MGIISLAYLAQGLSYWKVTLDNRRTPLSELDSSFDAQRGPRAVDWALDIVGAGDDSHITSITLCTPEGEFMMPITEKQSAFQFKRGTVNMLTGERIIQAQIIGRLEYRESGLCSAIIWDVQGHEMRTASGMIVPHLQHLFTLQTTIDNFGGWHPNVIPPGAMYRKIIGLGDACGNGSDAL